MQLQGHFQEQLLVEMRKNHTRAGMISETLLDIIVKEVSLILPNRQQYLLQAMLLAKLFIPR